MSIKKIIIIFWGITLISPIGLFSFDLDSLNQFTGWDTTSSYELTQKLRIGRIDHLEVLSDGKHILTADSGKYFRIWDIETGKITWIQEVPYQIPICINNDSLIYFRKASSGGLDIEVYNINSELITNVIKDAFVVESSQYIEMPRLSVILDSILLLSEVVYTHDINYNAYNTNSMFYNLISLKPAYPEPFEKRFANYLLDMKGNFISHEISYYQGWGTERSRNSYIIKCNNKTNIYDYEFGDYRVPRYFSLTRNQDNFLALNGCSLFQYSIFDDKFIRHECTNMNLQFLLISNKDQVISFDSLSNQLIALDYNSLNYSGYKLPINFKAKFGCLSHDSSSVFLATTTGFQKRIILDTLYKIRINPDFTCDSTTIRSMHEVNFRSQASGNANNYYWDFGDASTSTEPNPSHIYAKSGVYSVMMRLIYDKDTLRVHKKDLITVTPVYYPKIIQDKFSGPAPLVVSFDTQPDFPYKSLEWDFGDGKPPSNDQKTIRVFNDTGYYKIKLTFISSGKEFFVESYVTVFKEQLTSGIVAKEYFIQGYYRSDMNSLDKIDYSYEDYINSDANNFYTTLKKEDGHLQGSHTITTEFQYTTGRFSPDLEFRVFSQIPSFYQIGAYLNNGIIYYKGYSEVSVYDRNASYLFSKVNYFPGELKILDDNELYIISDPFIRIYNESLELSNIIDLSEFIKQDSSELYTDLIISGTASDKKYFAVAKNNSASNIWLGRFDSQLNFESGNNVDIKDFNQIIPKSDHELLFLDNKGNLSCFDGNGEVLYTANNPDFASVYLYDSIYLVHYDIEEKPAYFTETKVIFKFYSLKGQLINTLDVTIIGARANTFVGIYLHINNDNSVNLIWGESDNAKSSGVAHIFFPEDIELSIPNQLNISASFPNPSDNFVSIPVPAGKFISLDLYNIMGNRIECVYELIPSAGEDIIWLDISRLPIGAWYFRVNCSDSPLFGNFQKTK